MANIWVTPSIPFSSPSQPLVLFFSRSGSKWTSSHSLSVSLFPQQVAYQTACAQWPVSLTTWRALCKPKPPSTAFLLLLCESVIIFSIPPVVLMMTPSAEVWWPLQTWTLLQFPTRSFSPSSLAQDFWAHLWYEVLHENVKILNIIYISNKCCSFLWLSFYSSMNPKQNMYHSSYKNIKQHKCFQHWNVEKCFLSTK